MFKADPSFLEGIKQNALYQKPNEDGEIVYGITNNHKADVIITETIFWDQLILGLGSDFLANFNNYARYYRKNILDKIAAKEIEYKDDATAEGYEPKYRAILDVIMELVTKVSQTNLSSFFEKWGLQIPTEVQEIASAYGTDYGNDMFKILLDHDYSGLDNISTWKNNVLQGFLVPGISEKLKPFKSWGEIGGELTAVEVTEDKRLFPRAEGRQIAVLKTFKNSTLPNINYLSSVPFEEDPESSELFPTYIKIRGNVEQNDGANKHSMHIWDDREAQKIRIRTYNPPINNIDGVFVEVKLLDENNEIIQSREIEGKNMTLDSMDWDYQEGYTLQINFLQDGFELEGNRGSKIFDHNSKTFIPIKDFTNWNGDSHEWKMTL
ncbi:hypothetical protein SCLARK_001159 [Spiroplasma clarkii]|nr:hypothetical protein SCLARK_001159 [Spiroplasma clarkii]